MLPHPILVLMTSINYFVMPSHCSSVAYVRLTHSLEMSCALDRGQHGLLGADLVLWQWNFPTLSAASSSVLVSVNALPPPSPAPPPPPLSCSYFCLSACHIAWLSLADITLCSINKSFICHSGYCAFYLFQLWGTLLFSLSCCHTIENIKFLGANHLLSYCNAKQEKLSLSICSVFQCDGKRHRVTNIHEMYKDFHNDLL